MEKLVYAELMGSVTFEMLLDKQLLIISDNAIFIVSTPENAVNYPNEEFYPVDGEAMKAYEIEMRDERWEDCFGFVSEDSDSDLIVI